MNIVIVEDKIAEVSGYMKQLENNGHLLERFSTFSQAYDGLAERKEALDLIVIDIMLPWGDKVDVEVDNLYDWKRAGLYLIYAIRSIENHDLVEIRKRSKLPKKIPDTWQHIPIIALTKVKESVEEELTAVSRVAIVAKLDGLNIDKLPDLMHELNDKLDQAEDSGAPVETTK